MASQASRLKEEGAPPTDPKIQPALSFHQVPTHSLESPQWGTCPRGLLMNAEAKRGSMGHRARGPLGGWPALLPL